MVDLFTPPTWDHNESEHPLFGRMKGAPVGYGIIRDTSGAYTQVVDADDDDVKLSTAFYMGGRSYKITLAEKTDLTAAGYGAYIITE